MRHKNEATKSVGYVFHAMDPASVTFLHRAHGLFIVENSHSVTDNELLHSHTATRTRVSLHCFSYLLLVALLQPTNGKQKDFAWTMATTANMEK